MRSSGVIVTVLCGLGGLALGCLSDARRFKSASGAPSAISMKALQAGRQRPRAIIGSAARANRASAADQGEPCSAAEEGRGVCVERWLVFCSNRELYALDCGTFLDDAGNAAGCGEVEGGVLDCGSEDARD